MADWTTAQIPDQSGRTALVTGASSGLGLRSAEALAAAGARVLLGCRNPQKAEAALEAVTAAATGPAPEVVPIDLADLTSVEEAATVVDRLVDSLDVLMNNAGVMAVPLRRTPAGHELQFGTNHLGHFALTGRLLPVLRRSGRARVVNVASNAHRFGTLRWQDLNWRHGRYSRWRAYGQSKLANLLFSSELQLRAIEAGMPLTVATAHPGYARTHLSTAGPEMSGNPVTVRIMRLGDRIAAQTDAQGALPQLYAATMPDVGPDDYFGPDGPGQLRGGPRRVGRSRSASDLTAAHRLWKVSEHLTGVTYAWR